MESLRNLDRCRPRADFGSCYRLTSTAENGQVYTWGRNGSGELGHGDKSGVPQLQPKQVVFFKSKCVKEVVCGGEHTLARTGITALARFLKGIRSGDPLAYTWDARRERERVRLGQRPYWSIGFGRSYGSLVTCADQNLAEDARSADCGRLCSHCRRARYLSLYLVSNLFR